MIQCTPVHPLAKQIPEHTGAGQPPLAIGIRELFLARCRKYQVPNQLGERDEKMRPEEAKELLLAGEEVLLEQPRAALRVHRPDRIGVRSPFAYVVLTNRRLMAFRWSLMRGYRWTKPYIHLPLDHLETWEATETLRIGGAVLKRLKTFIRIETANPTSTIGFTVDDPKAWIAALDRQVTELSD